MGKDRGKTTLADAVSPRGQGAGQDLHGRLASDLEKLGRAPQTVLRKKTPSNPLKWGSPVTTSAERDLAVA